MLKIYLSTSTFHHDGKKLMSIFIMTDNADGKCINAIAYPERMSFDNDATTFAIALKIRFLVNDIVNLMKSLGHDCRIEGPETYHQVAEYLLAHYRAG